MVGVAPAFTVLGEGCSAFDADVTVATYAFFADDRRASRTVTNRGGLNGVTYYFYDGHEVIEERDGSGAVVQQYLFGPQHIDELLLTLGENGANRVHQAEGDQGKICKDGVGRRGRPAAATPSPNPSLTGRGEGAVTGRSEIGCASRGAEN